jgi:signal transduction histidine kinase
MGATRPMALPVAVAADVRSRIAPRALTPWWAAALALPLVAAAAVKLALSSDHLAHPAATAAYRAYLIAVPALIGLAWWRRRPGSRYGPLLVLLGLAGLPLALESSSTAGLVVIGVIGEPIYFGLCVFMLVAFPRARLRTKVERCLVAGCVLSTLVFYVPSLLFLPELPAGGLTPFVACAPACPDNPFQVATEPGIVEATTRIAAALVLVASVALAGLFLARLRRATRPERREVVAIAATAFPFFPALALMCAATVVAVPDATQSALEWVLTLAGMVFTLGFLVALLQAELFAGAALRRLLTELAARPAAARWRDAVAAALGDASLRLAFWDPARRVFREADGTTLERPAPGDARGYTLVEHAGEPVAAITTDEALGEQPELLEAAARATLVAVRAGHLEGELRDSRLRLLAAGNAERRRIQRDLHDSAQQRLVALRIHLDLMSQSIDAAPETRAAIADLGEAVEEAIEDLRRVAHGLYPPMLERFGVIEALRSACRHTALPVRIVDEGIGRQSAAVESTLYFCCLEALQNAAKHAGTGASATVRIGADARAVWFAVDDDGAGFDAALASGTGLGNLRDRVAAMGGSFDVESAPGSGARLAGRFPAPPATAAR